MDNEQNLTPEEEVTAQEAPQEDEIRERIIDEYGFDEYDDSDKIDKLVEKDVEQAKKLSSAIGQKIKAREKAAELQQQLDEKEPTPAKTEEAPSAAEDLDKTLDDKLTERLENNALEDLEYPEELTNEIRDLAKLKGVSVKQILRDPYIVSRVEDHEKEQKAEEASISPTNKKRGKKAYSFDTPPDGDMATDEGRKEHEDWKAEMIKQGH